MWIISLFLALLILAIGQVWVYKHFGFRKVTYKRWFEPLVVNEGDTVEMVETIRNEKLLPIPWLRIEAEISPNLRFQGSEALVRNERHFHRSIFSMPPYMTITRRHFISCPHRGYFHINSVTITTGDLLGLGKDRMYDIPTDSTVVVYPSLIPIEDIFDNKNSFTGDTVVRRWIVEDPFMIKGVREYTSSDPYNHINWKATARTGELQVHDFDFTADIKLLIIVNIDATPTQWTVTLDEPCAERALSIAASCAQYAIDNGIETGFITNARGTDMEPDEILSVSSKTGQEQVTEIFEAIARAQLRRTLTFPTLLQKIATDGLDNSEILLITAYTDTLIDEQIENLRKAGSSVILIDPHTGERLEEAVL